MVAARTDRCAIGSLHRRAHDGEGTGDLAVLRLEREVRDSASGRKDDLFSEEGFSQEVAAVCPACATEMDAGAVLCTKCGYNKQTGQRLTEPL